MTGYKFIELPIIYLSEGGVKKRDMGMTIDQDDDSEDFEVQMEMVNIFLIERYASALRKDKSIIYMGGESMQCNLSVAELGALLIS